MVSKSEVGLAQGSQTKVHVTKGLHKRNVSHDSAPSHVSFVGIQSCRSAAQSVGLLSVGSLSNVAAPSTGQSSTKKHVTSISKGLNKTKRNTSHLHLSLPALRFRRKGSNKHKKTHIVRSTPEEPIECRNAHDDVKICPDDNNVSQIRLGRFTQLDRIEVQTKCRSTDNAFYEVMNSRQRQHTTTEAPASAFDMLASSLPFSLMDKCAPREEEKKSTGIQWGVRPDDDEDSDEEDNKIKDQVECTNTPQNLCPSLMGSIATILCIEAPITTDTRTTSSPINNSPKHSVPVSMKGERIKREIIEPRPLKQSLSYLSSVGFEAANVDDPNVSILLTHPVLKTKQSKRKKVGRVMPDVELINVPGKEGCSWLTSLDVVEDDSSEYMTEDREDATTTDTFPEKVHLGEENNGDEKEEAEEEEEGEKRDDPDESTAASTLWDVETRMMEPTRVPRMMCPLHVMDLADDDDLDCKYYIASFSSDDGSSDGSNRAYVERDVVSEEGDDESALSQRPTKSRGGVSEELHEYKTADSHRIKVNVQEYHWGGKADSLLAEWRATQARKYGV